MEKELKFLEEKHGNNSWTNYPPSKLQVAQWLNEFAEYEAKRQQRDLLIDFCLKLEEKAKEYNYLVPNVEFIKQYLEQK